MIPRIHPLRLCPFLISLFCISKLQVSAFLSLHPTTSYQPTCRRTTDDYGLSVLHATESDDEVSNDDNLAVGPEKSRMKDYIAQYLGKTKNQENDETTTMEEQEFNSLNLDTSTHLVAIPMDACHELLIELESVQRAILYHCPILLDACIPGSMTKLPLLYVRADNQNSARVTSFLADAVTSLAKKHLFSSETDEEESISPEEFNEDGFRPFTITFQSLEIDGDNNNVLNTVGLPTHEGTKKLQAFVTELETVIHAMGWKTAYPLDPLSKDGIFRPRIPFMELPKAFDDNLNRFKAKETIISEEDSKFLTSEQGGNGISPIFFCQWWDDTFARNCRLREVGIYPKTPQQSDDLTLSMFYLPYETIPLPDGTLKMQKSEQKFEKYQDERILEEQKELERQRSGNDDSNLEPEVNQNVDPDILMTKTRERLENLYMSSVEVGESTDVERDLDFNTFADQVENEPNEESNEMKEDNLNVDWETPTASPDDYMDDWMESRIRKVIESRESIQSRKPEKKDKPPIEDNPVFKAYKEGTLVPKQEVKESKGKRLGPYPGRDHFVGIWKFGTTPTGFSIEEGNDESCENIILRVDGTTAGGPILDTETKQKAAGGTWKYIEDENDIRLRIRLVIPPKKERILVMEGIVNRISMNLDIPMTSKAFGIPKLEAMAKEGNKSKEKDTMHCAGDVFIEDAVTKQNRENIGTFSLMKLQGPLDTGKYTITIPKPIRNQD